MQTPVSALAGVAVFDNRSISDGSGGMFVTWEDRRHGDTLSDIYAQRVGSDGRQKWTEHGVEVCRFEFLQDHPLIVADGAGGCIIVWMDDRTFNDGRPHYFAQRFNATGSALWAANGIRVCTNNDRQEGAAIITRPGGGAIIAWRDFRAAPGFRHIYAQALDLNGNRLFTDAGLAVATDDLPHLDINVVGVDGNDTMVLWRGNSSVIKAVLLSDPDTVIDAFPENSGTRGLKAISDGMGGVIAGIFRFFETAGEVGVWVQRISPDLVVAWDAGGVLLSPNTADDPDSEITLASDGAGGAYVAWHTEPGNNMNIYAQRVSATGTPLWTANGITVADEPEDEEAPGLLADAEGVYIWWRAEDDRVLRAHRLDTDGTPVWAGPIDVAVEEGINAIRDFGLAPGPGGGVVTGFSIFPAGEDLDVVAKHLLADGTLPQSRLINVSTRAFVGPDAEQLIGGFVIIGAGLKRVLVRGVGPQLSEDPINLTGVLADPTLTLYNSANEIVADNDDWGENANATEIEATTATLSAFALNPGSADAALLIDLPPGGYTPVVGGAGGSTGIGLVEIYDAEPESNESRLVNVSSRGFVGTGDEVIIPGFIVAGDATMRILVRAVGETLGDAPYGVPGVLPDPQLEFRTSSGAMLGANDNWSSNSDEQAVINASIEFTGAFALPAGSMDAAAVFIVGPGLYTPVVSGVDETTGVSLVEAYESF